MNGKEHRIIGSGVGIGTYVLDRCIRQRPLRLVQAIGSGVGGYVGGHFPDDIEPAFHPNHRDSFHSVGTGVGVTFIATKSYFLTDWLEQKSEWIDNNIKESSCFLEKTILWIIKFLIDLLTGFVIGFLGGYVSHIVLDATTSKSIPWV